MVEPAVQNPTSTLEPQRSACGEAHIPEETASRDRDVLRAALIRESDARRRAECLAAMQTEIVHLALDLLVREPDIDGFFASLTKAMVEEGDSQTCGVWLIGETGADCELWMVYVKDKLYCPRKAGAASDQPDATKRLGCASLAAHLFEYRPGWTATVDYAANDPRLPGAFCEFARQMESTSLIVTPMTLDNRTLGWLTMSTTGPMDADDQWWRKVLLEAVAGHAALALHHSRLIDLKRREERRKAILEERNRLARDIHDNLAQGFAAILMQLQAATRQPGGRLGCESARNIETAIELARTHLAEARRSVGALRPNVGVGEDVLTALKRLTEMSRRTTDLPIELVADELPRLGDIVEREVIGIAQEALTNAVRHARAGRITIRASAIQSVGLRLSVADDGRGFGRERSTSGFGLTSMQERADRIGASLTIVTAPRSGTEVVLAWEPSRLPEQVVHAAH